MKKGTSVSSLSGSEEERKGKGCVCPFPPGVRGWGGDGGRGEGYGTQLSLVAKRGEMLKPVGQSVVWNSGAHFPTETKLKWRLAPRLAQRSQTQLIATQPQKTLHLLHTLPLSVTGGAHRSSGSSGGRALVAVETGPRAAPTQA